MRTQVLATIAIFSAGCALGDGPDIDTDGAAQDARFENEPTAPPMETPTASAPRIEDPQATIDFSVTPVDWGLFDGPPGNSFSQRVPLHDGVGTVELELPPGAFAVRGFDDDGFAFDGTSGSYLDPANGEQTDGPFFNPSHGRFVFQIRVTDGEWSVVSERVSTGAEVAWDVPTPGSEVGPWFDEAYANGEVFDALYDRGGPVVTKRGVLLIAPTTNDDRPPFVRASWNSFALEGSAQLRTIAPGVAARFFEVDIEPHTYRFFDPSSRSDFRDVTNRFVTPVADGFDSGLFPDAPRTVWLRNISRVSREVYVHLPASYGTSVQRRYPTMYVYDGLASITDGRFDAVADEIGALTPSFETITVFIAPPDATRLSSSMNVGQVDFVATTLVPFVESSFRAISDRRARGTAGASFGGVASFWTAVRHADTFGYTVGISAPLVDAEPVVGELNSRGCQDVVFRVAASTTEPGAMATGMRDTLQTLGCDYDYVTDARHDDWATYGERFADGLLDFAHVHTF